MPQTSPFTFRSVSVAEGEFVVLWETVAAGRTILALVPTEMAQPYLNDLQEGKVPDCRPQLVEQVGPSLVPLEADVQTVLIQCLALDGLVQLTTPA